MAGLAEGQQALLCKLLKDFKARDLFGEGGLSRQWANAPSK